MWGTVLFVIVCDFSSALRHIHVRVCAVCVFKDCWCWSYHVSTEEYAESPDADTKYCCSQWKLLDTHSHQWTLLLLGTCSDLQSDWLTVTSEPKLYRLVSYMNIWIHTKTNKLKLFWMKVVITNVLHCNIWSNVRLCGRVNVWLLVMLTAVMSDESFVSCLLVRMCWCDSKEVRWSKVDNLCGGS